MNQLQIKATLLDIENRTDKNSNPYFRLSLVGMPARYFYAFSNNLSESTLQLLKSPHNLINRQVLITYEETRSSKRTSVVGDQIPNKDQNGTFFKVQQIEIL
jgi:hypothetical protein